MSHKLVRKVRLCVKTNFDTDTSKSGFTFGGLVYAMDEKMLDDVEVRLKLNDDNGAAVEAVKKDDHGAKGMANF